MTINIKVETDYYLQDYIFEGSLKYPKKLSPLVDILVKEQIEECYKTLQSQIAILKTYSNKQIANIITLKHLGKEILK